MHDIVALRGTCTGDCPIKCELRVGRKASVCGLSFANNSSCSYPINLMTGRFSNYNIMRQLNQKVAPRQPGCPAGDPDRLTSKSQRPSKPISQPHFDEEATLLSARPVVPLKEVKAKARSKRRLFFALAIMISLLFGAFTAILISYLQHAGDQATVDDNQSAGTKEQTSISADGVKLASSSPGAGGSSIESDPTASARKNGEPTSGIHSLRKSRQEKNQTPRATRSATASSATSEAVQNDVPNPDRDGREASRDRSEARRRRREAVRKSRKNRDESSDDLLRIREIFEGAPRP